MKEQRHNYLIKDKLPSDWDILPIEKIVAKDKGSIKIGPFGSSLKKEYLVKEGYKVYGQENIIEEDFTLGERFIDRERFELLRTNEILPGDIVMSMMGTIGKVLIVPDSIQKGIMDSHLLRIRLDENLMNKDFFIQLFKDYYPTYKQIQRMSVGGIMSGLSSSIIRKIKLPVPPLKEQLKISSILSVWDKAIELKEKLIEQKKELKKGLMQKLLTGEVRLPGYKYSWKVYTIEQLAEFFTDGDWIEAPYITEDGVLLIQTGNIGIGEYIEKNNMKFISEKSFIELNCTEVKPGDILICRLADPIGRSCIVPNTGIKMITAVDVAIFRVNNNLAVTEFINYKLNLPKTLQKMDSLGAGSTRKRISRKNLGKVKLTIPDLEEQKAIADILLQIDKNIVLLEKELGELKKQKKGLMQLLLTGKVRVKV